MFVKFMLMLATVAVVIHISSTATTFRKMRSLEADVPISKSKENCQKNAPCGWAVYNRYTREIEYFMRNKCECREGYKCFRTDDDISVTAFVYRCKDADNPNKKDKTTHS